MFFKKMTAEKKPKTVSDRIFERAQKDSEALSKLRESNPSAVPSTDNSSATPISRIKKGSPFNRIIERASRDRAELEQFAQDNAHPNDTKSAPPVQGPSLK